MTLPESDLPELRQLLDAVCEETITPEQVRRLEELLLAHPEAEAFYVQYLSLHADLARHFAALPATTEQTLRDRLAGQRPAKPATPAGPARRSRFLFRATLAVAGLAATALLAVTLARLVMPGGSNPVPPPEPGDNSVAVLLRAPGAEWGEADLPTRPGSPLGPGRLRLDKGFAHIEFYSGATVILQGPADFRIVSAKEAYCERGKLRATVPPQAAGFTIGSPKLALVDRGTEFGLSVDGGEKAEVHVFQGKVEVYGGGDRPAGPHQDLTTGKGLRVDGPGRPSPIASDPSAFLTARDLAQQAERELRQRQNDWLAAGEELRKDPSLVVYYPFETADPWSRTMPDQANGRRDPHDGSIIGCSWVTGRWPGKQALEFKRVSDRVRLHVPGEFEALTLAAWVRVDALPHRYNALFLTDGWDEGAPHWHVGESGVIALGVHGHNQKGNYNYTTPRVFTPDRLGQWTQLAVVFDRAGRQVTHYVNGKPVKQEPLRVDQPLHLGDAEIGNWNVGERKDNNAVRYFTGCIDEFMLFSRALGEGDVEKLYTQGRPPG
jgi:ferric-dicitrate binding protein FerR (iron transport regulator)